MSNSSLVLSRPLSSSLVLSTLLSSSRPVIAFVRRSNAGKASGPAKAAYYLVSSSSSSAILSRLASTRRAPHSTAPHSTARPAEKSVFLGRFAAASRRCRFDRDFFRSLPFFLSASSSASSSSLTGRFSRGRLGTSWPPPLPSSCSPSKRAVLSAVHFLNSSGQIITAKTDTGALYLGTRSGLFSATRNSFRKPALSDHPAENRANYARRVHDRFESVLRDTGGTQFPDTVSEWTVGVSRGGRTSYLPWNSFSFYGEVISFIYLRPTYSSIYQQK